MRNRKAKAIRFRLPHAPDVPIMPNKDIKGCNISWDTFFAALPFVAHDVANGKRYFWCRKEETSWDVTADCPAGQHEGIERGSAWALQMIAALEASDRRGVLLRILRDMEFGSAEAVGFIGELEDQLAAPRAP